MTETTKAEVLLVVFAHASGDSYLDSVPKAGFDVCVIGGLGDFVSIELAQEVIQSYEYVVFVHEGLVVNYDVLNNMIAKVKSDSIFGVVYSDYLQAINQKLIPRLRRTYKRSAKNTKNKGIPIFGAIFSGDLVSTVLAELIHTEQLTLDTLFQSELTQHVPYHIPEFMFRA